ncbi:MAG: TonB-dependent receptor plug domain-containing protein [Gemmatimonas sp.]|nr:TonB-dependent receptor plug domain-containing protein [Gemmatimonas sp.]
MNRMRIYLASSLLALVLVPVGLAAQETSRGEQGSLEGIVTEADTGRPLGSVQVAIPELRVGTLTNAQGRFTISDVPDGTYTAQFIYLGYGSEDSVVTVATGEPVTLEVALARRVLDLEEVVVTGTAGNARQREVGSAVSRLDATELATARAAPSLSQALQGQVPGLMMSQSGPQAGSAPNIAFRGRNSVSQGDEPLVYVDGVRMYSRRAGTGGSGSGGMDFNPISHLKAEDIQRIEMVRGPAATTLYGTEASGGVIQIFTRRGSANLPTQWSVGVTTGVHTLLWPGPAKGDNNPDGLGYMNCLDRVNARGEVYRDLTCPSDGDWVKPAFLQRYNLRVSGGVGGFTYALSGRVSDEGAPIDGSGNDFYEGVDRVGYTKDGGFRANFTMDFTPTLRAGWNSSLSLNTQRWVPIGAGSASVWSAPMQRGKQGAVQVAGEPASGLHFSQADPIDRRRQVMTGFTLDHFPSSWFDHRLSVGYDLNGLKGEHWYHVGHIMQPEGMYQLTDWEARTATFDYGANFRASLWNGDITSTTSAGFQAYREYTRNTRTTVEDFPGPLVKPTLVSGATRLVNSDRALEVVNAGGYLQQVLGWKDFFFLTAGVRVDGNSAFGSGFGLQAYPKLSASYVLSDMAFWPSDWFELFRLRGAMGEAGKAPGAFDAVRSWGSIVSGDLEAGFTPGSLGNSELGPERSREYEVGFDASLYGGRVTAEVTGFLQRTYDALVPVQHPPSQGFLSAQLTNVGTLENRGAEISLGLGLMRRRNFQWDVDLMLSLLESEAIDLGGEEIPYGFSQFSGSRGWVREGYPVPAIFGAKVVNAGEIADPIIEEDSYIGPAYPTHTFGFRTSVTLLNDLSISAFGEYQGGSFIQNQTGQRMVLNETFMPCFPGLHAQQKLNEGDPSDWNNLPAEIRAKCSANPEDQRPDRWYESNAFFRLRYVNLDYQLPAGLVPGAQSAALTLSASNLLTVTDYWGNDPEARSGADFPSIDYHAMPGYRTFTASLNVAF